MSATQLLRFAVSSNSRVHTVRRSASCCSANTAARRWVTTGAATVNGFKRVRRGGGGAVGAVGSGGGGGVAAAGLRAREGNALEVGEACSARRFSASARRASAGENADETYEEFTIRYEREFDAVNDVFELQRNLNNAFAYDLVPAPSVIVAALKAARRVNDFPTAVRIFEGVKAKVENKMQYEEYVKELEPLREELGVPLKETLYPNTPTV